MVFLVVDLRMWRCSCPADMLQRIAVYVTLRETRVYRSGSWSHDGDQVRRCRLKARLVVSSRRDLKGVRAGKVTDGLEDLTNLSRHVLNPTIGESHVPTI